MKRNMSQDVPKHDRNCWCWEQCLWKPISVTDIINDYREYAEDVLKKTGQVRSQPSQKGDTEFSPGNRYT